jgi:hypothetical protein
MINKDEQAESLKCIIRAQHDSNCGLSNAGAWIRMTKELLSSEAPDIAKAQNNLDRALDSIKYAGKHIDGLSTASRFVRNLQ